MSVEFDAIVVGSGMTGGWAAKALTERGLKTLVIERGRNIEHGGPEYTDMLAPWEDTNLGLVPEDYIAANPRIKPHQMNASNLRWFVSTEEQDYSCEPGRDFQWIRSYNLGGRSLLWGRRCYRMGADDFTANARDGHGVAWPMGYADLAPWYDHVERFIGVAGTEEQLAVPPDGQFLPAFEMSCGEKWFKQRIEEQFPGRKVISSRVANLTAPTQEHLDLGRGPCQARNRCSRGCSFGAYFSSLSATLPAAQRTGNLSILSDTLCERLSMSADGTRVTGVQTVNTHSGERHEYRAQVVFLCASAVASAQVLLNSASERHPRGVANGSDLVGCYLNDHTGGVDATGLLPGLEDRYYRGRSPAGFYIPRYRNASEPGEGYLRGFGFQGGVRRTGWSRGTEVAGIGADAKHALRTPGPWRAWLSYFGEVLPRRENRMRLHPTRRDRWGMPLVHFDTGLTQNEASMSNQAAIDVAAMLEAAGCRDINVTRQDVPLGFRIHEFGTAVMGADPNASVLNTHNQAHEVPNLFITDGAALPSAGCQNPSLTFMALTARAADYAATSLADGVL